jgi:hypothetical protein
METTSRMDEIACVEHNVFGAVEIWAAKEPETAEEHFANVRLIAAAPEMFAVLQRITAHFENTDAPLGLDAAALVARIVGDK